MTPKGLHMDTIYFLSHRNNTVSRVSPVYFQLAQNQDGFAPYTWDSAQSHLVPPTDYTADDIHTFHTTAEIVEYFDRLQHDQIHFSPLLQSFIALLEEDIKDFSDLHHIDGLVERDLRADIIRLNHEIKRLKEIKSIRQYCHDLTHDRTLYLTPERFAEAHEVTLEDAQAFLWIAKKIATSKHPEA